MWDLPKPGLEPASPALAGRFSTTAPPGKPKRNSWFLLGESMCVGEGEGGGLMLQRRYIVLEKYWWGDTCHTDIMEWSWGRREITRLKDPAAWGLARDRCSLPSPILRLGTQKCGQKHNVIAAILARYRCLITRGIQFSFLLLKPNDLHFIPKN